MSWICTVENMVYQNSINFGFKRLIQRIVNCWQMGINQRTGSIIFRGHFDPIELYSINFIKTKKPILRSFGYIVKVQEFHIRGGLKGIHMRSHKIVTMKYLWIRWMTKNDGIGSRWIVKRCQRCHRDILKNGIPILKNKIWWLITPINWMKYS